MDAVAHAGTAALGLLAMLTACQTGTPTHTDAPVAQPAPTLAQLKGATYGGIYEMPVELKDGRWEGVPPVAGGAARPTVMLIDGLWAAGDLDGDGSAEAVALLVESSGGSGSFLYLAALDRQGGRLVNVATTAVGDRVQLRGLRLVARTIELDVVQHAPDDPGCCPTQKATRSWRLAAQGLVEAPARVGGTVSIAELAGVEWVLTNLKWSEPAPTDPEITLIFEGSRVSGSSGCNRYFGAVEETQPAALSLGDVGSTRMACPGEIMLLESRYLQALRAVNRYSFHAGKLALSYATERGIETLLFSSRLKR
jgi:heat shock protein HslJ